MINLMMMGVRGMADEVRAVLRIFLINFITLMSVYIKINIKCLKLIADTATHRNNLNPVAAKSQYLQKVDSR